MQPGKLLAFARCHAIAFTRIDPSLLNPLPQAGRPDPKRPRNLRDRSALNEDQRDRISLELRGERTTPTNWLFLHH